MQVWGGTPQRGPGAEPLAFGPTCDTHPKLPCHLARTLDKSPGGVQSVDRAAANALWLRPVTVGRSHTAFSEHLVGFQMSASIHDKLNRVRKPRVHITYEVETEGAQIQRELPFVVGVMGDFSGDPTTPLKPLSERKFIQIDRDNFNDVMSRIGPGLNLKVDNTLAGDGSQMAVNLKFKSLDDFEPGRIVEQVPALKALMDTRQQAARSDEQG